MQVDRASHIIIVFWALIELGEKNKIHSVRNISDTINNPKLKNDTISKCLDYLEINGAIVCKYEKGKRKGKRLEYHSLNPECIPKAVSQAKVSESSSSRWKKAFAELGLARQEKGKTYIDVKALMEQGGEVFVKALENTINTLDETKKEKQAIDDVETWFIENLDGEKVEIDPNTLEFFHIWVCWKVKKLYGETN